MAIRRILVTLEADDDIDIDEYTDAIRDACEDVEMRAMISSEVKITVQED